MDNFTKDNLFHNFKISFEKLRTWQYHHVNRLDNPGVQVQVYKYSIVYMYNKFVPIWGLVNFQFYAPSIVTIFIYFCSGFKQAWCGPVSGYLQCINQEYSFARSNEKGSFHAGALERDWKVPPPLWAFLCLSRWQANTKFCEGALKDLPDWLRRFCSFFKMFVTA